MGKIFDDQMSLGGRCISRITIKPGNDGWIDGEVVTPHGIVSVYAQGDAVSLRHTRLDFALNGRLYMRNFQNKRYTPRGLVKLAREFAAEISGADHE